MTTSLDSIKAFFDPHPGFSGATIPISSTVGQVAKKLSGQNVSLREAVAQIQAVTMGTVTVRNGWISLELHESDGTIHMFRVIRFR